MVFVLQENNDLSLSRYEHFVYVCMLIKSKSLCSKDARIMFLLFPQNNLALVLHKAILLQTSSVPDTNMYLVLTEQYAT